MRPERNMVVCENGNIVMKKIALSYRKDNGEEIFLLDAEAVVEEKPNYRTADELYKRIEENFINIGLLKRVDMSSMSDDVIRELILKKHEKEEKFLNAGAERGLKFTEIELARHLGLSRTPVHEAVTRLEMDGLVELDGTGLTIRFNERQVEEIYDLRCLLEGYAVRLAAEAMDAETLHEIKVLHDRDATIDHSSYEERAKCNAEFHWLILSSCGNSQLIRLLEGFREYYPTKDLVRRYTPELSVTAREQHAAIITALADQDGERAEIAYREHLNLARSEILKGDNDGIP